MAGTRFNCHFNGPSAAKEKVKEKLSLRNLILWGIVCVTPIAPLPPFGIAQSLSRGHALLTIMIALPAMLATALSYGRMASLFPEAGSAYAYVTRGLNTHLGFLAGWITCLDYLVIPLANIIYCAATMHRVVPAVPYAAWAFGFSGLSTWLNLRGIRSDVRVNQILILVMSVVLSAFIVLAIKYVVGHSGAAGLLSSLPFYNPATFDVNRIRTATSFAALTYIGFDAVTTMSEDVRNPRRNVALATILVCMFIGIEGGFLVYLGQLVWPDYSTFTDMDTAFMDVMRRVGGVLLFYSFGVVLIVAQFGCALTSQAGAGRLLLGMGRDRAIPSSFFGQVDNRHGLPRNNILLVGALVGAGALLLDFQRAAELLNFGAFLAFMGVNLAVIKSYYIGRSSEQRRVSIDLLIPSIGFIFCFAIWLSLPGPAKFVGSIWLALGFGYQLVMTRGFRRPWRESEMAQRKPV
jgi:putrescine importer